MGYFRMNWMSRVIMETIGKYMTNQEHEKALHKAYKTLSREMDRKLDRDMDRDMDKGIIKEEKRFEFYFIIGCLSSFAIGFILATYIPVIRQFIINLH